MKKVWYWFMGNPKKPIVQMSNLELRLFLNNHEN
jgi:hypothetical protein